MLLKALCCFLAFLAPTHGQRQHFVWMLPRKETTATATLETLPGGDDFRRSSLATEHERHALIGGGGRASAAAGVLGGACTSKLLLIVS